MKSNYYKEDLANHDYLKEKWSKETVVIYSGPSWERWDFRNIDGGGIGGSETWVACLSREFDKLGYRTIVFADCYQSGIKDGNVTWLHYSEYERFIDQNWIDYFITSRTSDTLRFPIRAGKIYCMIHDIWLSHVKEILYKERVDKFCVLSEWHKEFVKEHHNIPEEKLWLTQNGIDLTRFDIHGLKRNPYRLVYSSSPDRGLDTLLYLFDFMKKEIPELELHIYYGFDNWCKAATSRGDESALKRIDWFEKEMKKDGVFYHGRVSQKELAKEFLQSSLWAYPSDFEETWCITANEVQAAGIPIIASNYAGLKTTVGDSGILIGNGAKGESYSRDYRIKFTEECLSLLKNKEKWQEWSIKGRANAEKYTWENAAKNWVKLFKS